MLVRRALKVSKEFKETMEFIASEEEIFNRFY